MDLVTHVRMREDFENGYPSGNDKKTLRQELLARCFVVMVAVIGIQGCGPSSDGPNAPQPAARQVAVSLDDGPLAFYYTYPDSFSRWHALTMLTDTLTRFRVPTTLFVIGRDIEQLPDAKQMLDFWLDAGVQLGNHSYSHVSFDSLHEDEITFEVKRTNELIREHVHRHNQAVRFFRFPFLQGGNTPEKKFRSRTIIRGFRLKIAPVSIGLDDWTFNERYRAAELAEDWELRYEIGQDYLRHARQSIAYWDSVGTRLMGRPIDHSMMLHVNRINRDYLGAILRELSARGFVFTDLDRALRDAVYGEPDEWATPNGVSWLEHVKQTRLMRNEPLEGPVR